MICAATKSLGVAAADFFARGLDGLDDGGSALHTIERGRERNDLAFPTFPSNGTHHLPQLFGINLKAGQSGDPEQAHVVAGVHYRIKAGEEVTSFGRVGNVHALDDEWDIRFRKFKHDIVPVEVGTVQNSEIRPLAPGLPLQVADRADDVRRLPHRDW